MTTLPRMGPAFLLAMAGIALAGCNPFLSDETRYAVEQNVLLPSTQPPLDPQFCYRTLAEVDCYLHPAPEEEYRRVGPIALPLPQATPLRY